MVFVAGVNLEVLHLLSMWETPSSHLAPRVGWRSTNYTLVTNSIKITWQFMSNAGSWAQMQLCFPRSCVGRAQESVFQAVLLVILCTMNCTLEKSCPDIPEHCMSILLGFHRQARYRVLSVTLVESELRISNTHSKCSPMLYLQC